MVTLDTSLRNNILEKAVLKAREISERGAATALKRLAVQEAEPYPALSAEERVLRNRLRAKMRQMGGFEALLEECAYEHWHRMLFGRFLSERGLLMHPTGVPVTLAECRELAAEEGAANGWALAERYASLMLPQIFRPEDPVLDVVFAPEDFQALESILGDLPAPVFMADDSLGWVYQFWQKKRKDEINASGEKIDSNTIGPVTQLFTEDYMVKFLLHNTLGAWWYGRHPGKDLPLAMEYLRLLNDGTPASGNFTGWPEHAKDLKVLDPCCGSGHFLVAAFEILLHFRMVEEGLDENEAGDAVLRENLFGLDIDQRCTQIAAFALALAAWSRGGFRNLPPVNVACSGIPLKAKRDEWMALAEGSTNLFIWGQLYDLFIQAPDLGSLIDVRQVFKSTFYIDRILEFQTLLVEALKKEKARKDENVKMLGVAAQGIAKAAELLASAYTLVVTNVPYLGRGKQAELLKEHLETFYQQGKTDLATAFVLRCLEFCAESGTTALVTPQNWLFLTTYTKLRQTLLERRTWNAVVRLGEHAFESTAAAGAFGAMVVISASTPSENNMMAGIDVSATRGQRPIYAEEKTVMLRGERPVEIALVSQAEQLKNPDARVTFESISGKNLLSKYAVSYQGLRAGDRERFVLKAWEVYKQASWEPLRSSSNRDDYFDGISDVILWENGKGQLAEYGRLTREKLHDMHESGNLAWGKKGVIVNHMANLRASIYNGEKFDGNTCVIIPATSVITPLILWTYCSSESFVKDVRKIDQKLSVTNATLVKVPFNLDHWQKVADEKYPNGLPEPYSEDPTQWLFHGHPANCENSLQVAVARLLGYRWPAELDDHMELSDEARSWVKKSGELLPFVDDDGIVCIPTVSGERAAADRLRDLLAFAYGNDWSSGKQDGLLNEVDYSGKTLHDWLRDGYFLQHCKLFHQRPFIWQVWDGTRNGFSALVNYHKLDKALLDRLTYTYLGDWIVRQRQAVENGESGAEALLVAALKLQEKLKLIIAGDPPYDIFVRWKPLQKQPVGWEPDLNDGVRLNIRPFVEAGVLRISPNIKWGKDRGQNPPGASFGSERNNDLHFTIAEKLATRKSAEVC